MGVHLSRFKLNVTECVFVEGPDSHRGHEARTSEEVNVRDQQDALHRLAAGLQAGETHVLPQRFCTQLSVVISVSVCPCI